MRPEEIIALVAVLLAVVGALVYIIKSKRQGRRCVGCPEAGKCGRAFCGGGCQTEKHSKKDSDTE